MAFFAITGSTMVYAADSENENLNLSGHAEWQVHEGYGGIAGVWNPATQTAEWKSHDGHGGIAGVWNPNSGDVEWKERNGYGGVAGVWVPDNADDYEAYLNAIGLY